MVRIGALFIEESSSTSGVDSQATILDVRASVSLALCSF